MWCSQGRVLRFLRCFCVERLRDFPHSLTQVAWFFCGGCMILFVERLHDFCFVVERLCAFLCEEVAWFLFWWRGCVIFLLRGCMILCWEVVWFLCMERLFDFFTHSGCIIYFSGGSMIFFGGEDAWFFCVERLHDFLFGEPDLFVKRLHDFFGKQVAWFFCSREVAWFCMWRGCVNFVFREVAWFFSLTHSDCMIYFSEGCVIFRCNLLRCASLVIHM